MTYQALRQQFIDFSVAKGHLLVPPALLVPEGNDPTVLFTVAGMQQFKGFYAHPDQAPAPRVVTIQPCIRTIDIDEVGDDTHLTVFDMLGHFSFGFTGQTEPKGPYFKQESIHFGWEFLTQVLGLPVERIRATYFGGDQQRQRDDESRLILESLEGLSLVEATADNFWGPVGNEGPCGPNVEFYVDGIEVWNSVFNEYHRDGEGNYTLLDLKGVDMGTGLERVLMAIQKVTSVYDTDLWQPALTLIRERAYSYDERRARIIADHTKAALYLLCDGVKPGNKGRDYILRRLIRRAVRAGQLIQFKDFTSLLELLVTTYGPVKESVREQGSAAIALFEGEKDKFLQSLQAGMAQLAKIMGSERGGELTGEQAFHLFETHGFPVELTQEICDEAGWTVDLTGFETEFTKHRQESRVGMEKLFQGGLADHEPATIAHHTAHHLLLAALRQILGDHVVQRGSNITFERLRVDVTHGEKITDDQLKMAEDLVNQKIAEDLPVVTETVDRDEALKSGALAEFGAKYPKEVSVYSIIDQDGSIFSRELCGGPHVASTGELGHFEILKEEASGAGIRRIRARVVS